MKIYLVATHGKGKKYFEDEASLIQFLNSQKALHNDISRYDIQVLEAKVERMATGTQFLGALTEENIRETKVSAVLGDDFAQRVETFKNLFEKFATQDKDKQDFVAKLNTTPVDKKAFSKLLTSHSDYLLYQVSDDVEYYKSILALHGFKKLDDTYSKKIPNTSYKTSVKTSDVKKKNFELAKAK